MEKTSIFRWFKRLFLWLVLCFNDTLEIFSFSVQCTLHMFCPWTAKLKNVSGFTASVFSLLTSAKHHLFFLVSGYCEHVWMRYADVMYVFKSLLSCFIVHSTQEEYGNVTRPDPEQPLPSRLDDTQRSVWAQARHCSQWKVIWAIHPSAYLWSVWVMVDGSLLWQQSCLSHFLWSVFVIFLFYFFHWILHFLLLHQTPYNVILFRQKRQTQHQLTLRRQFIHPYTLVIGDAL